MKHPLSPFQNAVREIVCWFLGHRWKSSWHQKVSVIDTSDYEKLSYRDRHSGNPYYEYSAGWKLKCRRCRRRERDPNGFLPWYRDYYRAFEISIRSVVSSWRLFRNDETVKVDSWLWFGWFCITDGLFQFFAYMDDARHWPQFLWDEPASWHDTAAVHAFDEVD